MGDHRRDSAAMRGEEFLLQPADRRDLAEVGRVWLSDYCVGNRIESELISKLAERAEGSGENNGVGTRRNRARLACGVNRLRELMPVRHVAADEDVVRDRVVNERKTCGSA